MEVLQDLKIMIPVLLGAVLALLGGTVTHFIFWLASVNHNRNALRLGLAAELKVVREELGSALSTYRTSIRNNSSPTPVDFVFPTPIFDANAGNLGHLRGPGLVSYMVGTYSSIRLLSEKARLGTSEPLRAHLLGQPPALGVGRPVARRQNDQRGPQFAGTQSSA